MASNDDDHRQRRKQGGVVGAAASKTQVPPKAGHRISMVRDVRIFVNTIDHAIRLMTDNGVPATAHREEKDGYIEYTVRIPTAAAEK